MVDALRQFIRPGDFVAYSFTRGEMSINIILDLHNEDKAIVYGISWNASVDEWQPGKHQYYGAYDRMVRLSNKQIPKEMREKLREEYKKYVARKKLEMRITVSATIR